VASLPTNEATATSNEIILGMEWLGTFDNKPEVNAPTNKRKADAITEAPLSSPVPIVATVAVPIAAAVAVPIAAAVAIEWPVSILRARHRRRWISPAPEVINLTYLSD
jgi:hypothetical protein